MKDFINSVLYIAFSIFIMFLTIEYIKSDENMYKSKINATVLSMIKEDHEINSKYYGVYKLENGNIINLSVNRNVYGSTKEGDNVSLVLNKYESGEAQKQITRLIVEVFLMLLSAFLVVKGLSRLF